MLLLAAVLSLAPQSELPDPAPGRDAIGPALRRELEEAADRGLAWLAVQQRSGGYWGGHVGHKQGNSYLVLRSRQGNEARGSGHMGVSALAGMAFLAGGHLPDRGRYGEVVRRGLDYVLDHVDETGLIQDGGTRMYSHAFATLFLAEVHGMAPSADVRAGLERAVHIIVDCQNALGAWRYNPFSPEADLSVTVCQLQALRAARNIGLQVPANTISAATNYVLRSRTPRGPDAGLFFYKIAGRGAYQKNHQYAINSAALTALASAGIYEKRYHDPALDFLEEEYGRVATWDPGHYFFWYGNYYACQAFFQAGGARFERYYQRLARDLLRYQQPDGRWINTTGPGDEFSTAVACMLLQLPRQYLPIFQR